MPLRSVEAATREDAIAAAREQFGPRARIIGVRRVRSGGVLGFFATERYVAEVEPDNRPRTASRPAAAPQRDDADESGTLAERAARLAAFLQAGEEPPVQRGDERVDEIAELLSTGPHQPVTPTYSRTAFPRPAATADSAPPPAPSAAFAMSMSASRSPTASPFPTAPVATSGDFRSEAALPAPAPAPMQMPPAADPFPFAPATTSTASTSSTSSSLSTSASSLSSSAVADEPYQRASFPRTSRKPAGPARGGELAPSAFLREESAEDEAAPSPFTAALARMVAGDRVVRQAVQDALDDQLARETSRDAGPLTPRTEPVGADEKSTGAEHHSNGAEHQEEKPVSELETTSGASPTAQPYPTWAVPASEATASREEAIAQILRSALAQNHSDEALADILRKVLADASSEPAFPDGGAPVPVPAPAPRAEPAAWTPPAPEPLWAPTVTADQDWSPSPAPGAVDSARPQPAEVRVPETAAPQPLAAQPAPLAVPDVQPRAGELPPPPQTLPTAPIDLTAPADAPPATPAPTPARAPTPAPAPAVAVAPAPAPAVAPAVAPAPAPAAAKPDRSEPAEAGAPAGLVPDEPAWAEVVLHEPAPVQPAETATTAVSLADAIRAQIMGVPVASGQPPVAEPAVAPPALVAQEPTPEPVADVVADVVAEVVAEVVADASPASTPLADQVPAAASAEDLAVDAAGEAEPTRAAAEPAPAADAAVETAAVAEETAAPAGAEDSVVAEVAEVSLPELARTASDPAPLPLDSTTIMPPLSLLPPLPLSRRGGGRPPVPPPSRPASEPREDTEARERREEQLATVTRLPVPPVESELLLGEEPGYDMDDMDDMDDVDLELGGARTAAVEQVAIEPILDAEPVAVEQVAVEPVVETEPVVDVEAPAGPDLPPVVAAELLEPSAPPFPATAEIPVDAIAALIDPVVSEPAAVGTPAHTAGEAVPAAALGGEVPLFIDEPIWAPKETGRDIVGRLHALGMPPHVLGADFVARAESRGTYAALTQALAARLPEAPPLPTGAGEVLFVVGPGVATLRAARAIAASLGLHPDCVQWASRGELAGLAPRTCRMTTIDAAIDRRQEAVGSGMVTIVAVDAPLRSDAYWMGQMLAVWTPVAVWAVVEATRKPEDMGPWLDELPRVDALVLQDTDLSVDPAAVLERVSLPVALLDGVRATPHRWASLLCERLETDRT